jgi:hypothetical protein
VLSTVDVAVTNVVLVTPATVVEGAALLVSFATVVVVAFLQVVVVCGDVVVVEHGQFQLPPAVA